MYVKLSRIIRLSASLYSSALYETAPFIHYSPRLSLAFSKRLNLDSLPLIIDWLLFFKLVWPSSTTPRTSMTISKLQCWRSVQLFNSNIKFSLPRVKAKVRVFSTFSKIPEVNLIGAEHMMAAARARTNILGSTYTRNGNGCAIEKTTNNMIHWSCSWRMESIWINWGWGHWSRTEMASPRKQSHFCHKCTEQKKLLSNQLDISLVPMLLLSQVPDWSWVIQIKALHVQRYLSSKCVTTAASCRESLKLPRISNRKLFRLCSACRRRLTIISSYLVLKSKKHNRLES